LDAHQLRPTNTTDKSNKREYMRASWLYQIAYGEQHIRRPAATVSLASRNISKTTQAKTGITAAPKMADGIRTTVSPEPPTRVTSQISMECRGAT
jgi:hypothetical protein